MRSIAARARTIYERVESVRRQGAFSPRADVDTVLASWARAFSPDNPDALTQRLAWDGLTRDLVAAAVDAPPDDELPSWTTWIDRIAHQFERNYSASSASSIWSAVVRASGGPSTTSQPALERQLMRELAAVGDRAVQEAGDGGPMSLWTAYPVLARQVATIAEGWRAATTELLERFEADRAGIGDAVNGGIDPGPIVDVDAGVSDPHDGRRRVAILHFANGLRVVYKPRDVEIERAFGALTAWLAARGFDPPIPAPRVVARDGYGWIEFVAHESFDDAAQVRRYFRQAGALIFLTHVLGSRDLHMENLVATRRGPVLIDLELLLQPELTGSESVADRSCLRTGLLSDVEFGRDDDVSDVGGLRGTGGADLKNGVVLNGELQTPDAYRDEIVDGFARAYDFAIAHREALLAEDGPLTAFRSAVVRVVVRPTNQYALLINVKSAPQYQRDGAVNSMLFDVLLRRFAGANERPREWPLFVEERRALDALDVPRFVVTADGRTLMSDGRTILTDYFARSPLESVRERIAHVSGEDRDNQRRVLERALTDSIVSRFGTPFESGDQDFTAAAEWIGRELRDRGVERAAATHHLYDGSLGSGVFLSALAATTGSAEWRRLASVALAPALAWAGVGGRRQPLTPPETSDPFHIGGCSGLGSIVYGLTVAAGLLGDERPLAAARRVAALIDRDRIAQDRSFDIVDGGAGAIMSLLALNDVAPDAALLQAAQLCGDHLIASHVEHAAGWTWPSAADGDTRRLIGFAHGAAGIGAALGRLADATHCSRYREAAACALAFVQRNFSEPDATWPVAEADAGDVSTTLIRMNAWCHGAPGIAIAAMSARQRRRREEDLVQQARVALERLPEWSASQADHLCCGHLGRADVLLTAGRTLGVADAQSRADAIGRRVLARARARQHFRLSTAGFEYRVFDPGFFRGLPGIGYAFLRLANPERIPSVLAFE